MNVREIVVALEVLRLIITRFFSKTKSQSPPSSQTALPPKPPVHPPSSSKPATPPPKLQHTSIMSARDALQSELKKLFAKREKNIYT